jgi:FkbM family methyltransferase
VLAIEASPVNAALLRASVARNGFRGMTVIEAAAGDVAGEVEFCPRGPWGHLATPGVDLPTVKVPMVAVDDLLDVLGSPPVGLVKVDVEGAEPRVFAGMARLLAGPDAPPLLYEANGWTLGWFAAAPQDLLGTLERWGYRSHLVDGPRLVSRRAVDFQPQTLCDYLAVKRRPVELPPGYVIEPSMSVEESARRVAADAAHVTADVRSYIGGALRQAPPVLLQQAPVIEALSALRQDEVASVRAAVSWWRGGSAGEPE